MGNDVKWIPCSERLPEYDGIYLVTCKVFGRRIIDICNYTDDLYAIDRYDFWDKRNVGGWYKYDSEYGYYEENDVIAWTEMPYPYDGDIK